MADVANNPVVEAQTPKFAVGDEVLLTVDGEQYNAVVKAVTPVGGSAAKYTVERELDGVTGFKSEKYVSEDRLVAKEAPVETEAPKVEETKVEDNKPQDTKEVKTPETPKAKQETSTTQQDAKEPKKSSK